MDLSKHEWLWPIIISAFGMGGTFYVTANKTETLELDVAALEERERGYIGTMAQLAQSQADLAKSQERLAVAMDEMNNKLDRALRQRPRGE
jgi:hypothetical protein